MRRTWLHGGAKGASLVVRSMGAVTSELPESLLSATGMGRGELAREARFLLALKLFELHRLPAGRAPGGCRTTSRTAAPRRVAERESRQWSS